MPVATFDTLKFANTLKSAGVPPEQAEAQAVAFAEVIQLNLAKLVDKDDLDDAKTELKREIKDTEQRLNAKIDATTADLKVQIAEIKGDIYLLKWMLGVLVGGVAAIVVRLFIMRGPIG